MWQITSDEVNRCCGLEAYLYLKFLKSSAIFFAWVAIVSGSVLIPTYIYGETNSRELMFSMERYTLLNAIGKPFKMWIVFGAPVVVGVSGFLFVYFFQYSVDEKK